MRLFSRLGLFEKAEVVLEGKLKKNPYYPFERVKQNADCHHADHQADSAAEDDKTGWADDFFIFFLLRQNHPPSRCVRVQSTV